jgi:hypothetical protein
LAALNPYRQRKIGEDTPGLVFKHKKINSIYGTENLSSLVYRVAPIPASLRDLVFDFGSLPEKDESDYISQMVARVLRMPYGAGMFHLN